eukprot:TRINITY_DN6655_c0_g1_i1.p2 TRINITY_DN6655_c0_g1~~TRINITY_DN6655_c0_g1_i1.p2  ORF type:complete len:192 (+),score=45.41 TRINITY_DN6655_c0_g1_i1:1311-1886(+)
MGHDGVDVIRERFADGKTADKLVLIHMLSTVQKSQPLFEWLVKEKIALRQMINQGAIRFEDHVAFADLSGMRTFDLADHMPDSSVATESDSNATASNADSLMSISELLQVADAGLSVSQKAQLEQQEDSLRDGEPMAIDQLWPFLANVFSPSHTLITGIGQGVFDDPFLRLGGDLDWDRVYAVLWKLIRSA